MWSAKLPLLLFSTADRRSAPAMAAAAAITPSNHQVLSGLTRKNVVQRQAARHCQSAKAAVYPPEDRFRFLLFSRRPQGIHLRHLLIKIRFNICPAGAQ